MLETSALTFRRLDEDDPYRDCEWKGCTTRAGWLLDAAGEVSDAYCSGHAVRYFEEWTNKALAMDGEGDVREDYPESTARWFRHWHGDR